MTTFSGSALEAGVGEPPPTPAGGAFEQQPAWVAELADRPDADVKARIALAKVVRK